MALSLPDLADANNAVNTGWYRVTASTKNAIGASAMLRVEARETGYIKQTEIRASTGYERQRVCINGTWSEWEWVNPPMIVGIEYRTTERWNEKPVYKRITNVGTMPNNTTVTYDSYIPKAGTVLNIKFIMFDANSNWWRSNHPTAFDYWCEAQYTDNYQLHVKVTSDFSVYTCYIMFEYTKG